MSSGQLPFTHQPHYFAWSDELVPADYTFATYNVRSAVSGEQCALGMAMEQSAATLNIVGFVEPAMLRDWTIRVRSVIEVPDSSQDDDVQPYFLATDVYRAGHASHRCRSYAIELALPNRLFSGKPSQLLNIIVGELPRLGFLVRFRLQSLHSPAALGPGPAFGRAGILAQSNALHGPLLCRSMRPAVGLAREVMAQLHREVLIGGFHWVKDDELLHFSDVDQFKGHVCRMVQARDEAAQHSGERKFYVANLICEPHEVQERWHLALEAGVDAVLVAPFIQGFGVLAMLARDKAVPLLAHNTVGEVFTRHPHWGIDDGVITSWLRHLGADWFVTPGPFASHAMDEHLARRVLAAALADCGDLRPMMPILQGGKCPDGLPQYLAALGSRDFMLIVASWVDAHPQGLRAAAQIFRSACDDLLRS